MKTLKTILLTLGYGIITYLLMLLYAIGATAWAWLPLMFTFYGKSFWLGFVIGIFVSHIAHIIYREAN